MGDLVALSVIPGVIFATVAAVLRRRYGTWALLAGAAGCLLLAVTVSRRLIGPFAIFWSPALPSILVAAGVQEWRARRSVRAALWRDITWGALAFAFTALVGMLVLQVALRGQRIP
ncbi:MAG TPA: hypothetical protein VFP39_07225 [Gemmatimonadales bacterium]|nr:hypothetical protein [Gemmatimonadales bacterium]